MKFGFKRKNHLKSKVVIDEIFSKGRVITQKPFRLVFLELESPKTPTVEVMISVPKRQFKLAVSRNRIRRLISESYRLKTADFQQKMMAQNRHIAVAIIYIGRKEIGLSKLHPIMESVVEKLDSKLNES